MPSKSRASALNISLIPYQQLSALQRSQLCALELTAGQRMFVGDIHGALHMLTATPATDILGIALLIDDVARGFFVLKRAALLPEWAPAKSASLHGLMIDRRYQGMGLGRQCLTALPALVDRLWPGINQLMLAVDRENRPALALYLSAGWQLCNAKAWVSSEQCMSLALTAQANT